MTDAGKLRSRNSRLLSALSPRMRMGYGGMLEEVDTRAQYLGNGHRLYRFALMRLCSPDRLSPFARGGLNAYVYCGADPVNRVDPSGRFALWLVAGIAAMGAMGVFGGAAASADRAGYSRSSDLLLVLGGVVVAAIAAAPPTVAILRSRARGSHGRMLPAARAQPPVSAATAMPLPRLSAARVSSAPRARMQVTSVAEPRSAKRVRFAVMDEVRYFRHQSSSSSSSSSSEAI